MDNQEKNKKEDVVFGQSNLRKCQFCAEEIQKDAVKCKHCGSMLNEQKKDNDRESSNEDKKRIIKTLEFEISKKGQKKMDGKVMELKREGWSEVNRVSKKKKVIITYEKYIAKNEEGLENKKHIIEWIKKHPILTIFLVFLFFFLITAMFSKDNPSTQQTNSENLQNTETNVSQIEEAVSLAQVDDLLLKMKKEGFVIKSEITGAENELLYIYVPTMVWNAFTREEKNFFLKSFGEPWQKGGNTSVIFYGVETGTKLGRWSHGEGQIYK